MTRTGVKCITKESMEAEGDRIARIEAVWERTRRAITERDIGDPKKLTTCALCNYLRKYARQGLVRFLDMAEVSAVGCDSEEFEFCWPMLVKGGSTIARPGSAAKIAVLASRFATGAELFAEGDFECRDQVLEDS